jgi:hypothetical protein
MAKVHISFTYWCGGVHDHELNLMSDGTVVYQPMLEQGGVPHGEWSYDDDKKLIVQFDHHGRSDHLKVHVFEKINDMTNAFKLMTRDGYNIPNPQYHKHRCLLLLNEESLEMRLRPRSECI